MLEVAVRYIIEMVREELLVMKHVDGCYWTWGIWDTHTVCWDIWEDSFRCIWCLGDQDFFLGIDIAF